MVKHTGSHRRLGTRLLRHTLGNRGVWAGLGASWLLGGLLLIACRDGRMTIGIDVGPAERAAARLALQDAWPLLQVRIDTVFVPSAVETVDQLRTQRSPTVTLIVVGQSRAVSAISSAQGDDVLLHVTRPGAIVERYHARFGRLPTPAEIRAYNAVRRVIEAINSGARDAQAIRHYLSLVERTATGSADITTVDLRGAHGAEDQYLLRVVQ